MRNTLSCSAGNCIYNMSGLCSANTINVSGVSAHTSDSTECGTFAERGLKSSLTNVVNTNIPGQFAQLFNSASVEMSPTIVCNAENCRYNQNRACTAPNIMISGPGALSSNRTCCETFVE